MKWLRIRTFIGNVLIIWTGLAFSFVYAYITKDASLAHHLLQTVVSNAMIGLACVAFYELGIFTSARYIILKRSQMLFRDAIDSIGSARNPEKP